jgi:pSer/pThr/pTyr-binding forkhead associated (FHA) protein
MTEIIVRYEDKVVERVITEKQRISVGRTSDNDIILDNRGISRKHAIIEVNSKNTVIIDNESLNGTFVNDRRVEEEILQEEDVITIGKYTLSVFPQAAQDTKQSDLDGTMILNTKKQRARLSDDQRDRDIVARAGGSAVLVGESGTDIEDIRLGGATLTFGKANFVNVRVTGWFVPDIQARLTIQDGQYILTNVGHHGKTKVNGQPIDEVTLRNADLVQIGRSVFRFVTGLSS